MAARLGLLPWERDRLAPVQLKELWDGWVWRRSRDMEATVTALLWVMKAQGVSNNDVDYLKLIESMPGYDGEYVRVMRERVNWPPPDNMR